MRVYFVSTNVDFTTIVKTTNKRKAEYWARICYLAENGVEPDGVIFWVQPIEEYLDDDEVVWIKTLPELVDKRKQ